MSCLGYLFVIIILRTGKTLMEEKMSFDSQCGEQSITARKSGYLKEPVAQPSQSERKEQQTLVPAPFHLCIQFTEPVHGIVLPAIRVNTELTYSIKPHVCPEANF